MQGVFVEKKKKKKNTARRYIFPPVYPIYFRSHRRQNISTRRSRNYPALALIHALFSIKGTKAKGKSVNPFVSSISAKPLLPTPKPSNEEAKTSAREQIEVRNSGFDSASVAAVLGRMLPLFAVWFRSVRVSKVSVSICVVVCVSNGRKASEMPGVG